MAKWVIYGFLLAMLISGVYCLNENYEEKRISEWDDTLDGNMIMEGSLANFGRTSIPSLTQPWLHVGCMWFFLLLHTFLLHRHKALIKELDRRVITPSDYVCVVTKLPKDLNVEHFKAFIEEKSGPVWDINLSYDVNELKKATESVLSLRRKLKKLEQYSKIKGSLPRTKRCLICYGAVESIEQLQSAIVSEEDRLQRAERAKTESFNGIAYVIFEQDEGIHHIVAKKFAKEYSKKKATGLKAFLQVFFRCFIREEIDPKNIYRNLLFRVKRAPEPDDILWENLGVCGIQVLPRLRKQRRIITNIATVVLLLVCAGVIYCSSLSKEAINDKKNSSPSPSPGENLLYSLLIFLPSILVVVINSVLAVTIRVFSKMEMHKTVTDYDSSVMVKLTISMFLNTAVVAIAYHWGEWYKPAGLTQEVYNILIANAIVQPLLTVFSPAWFLKKLLQCYAQRKGDNSLLTQQEANDLFEGVQLDMAQRCACFIKTYLLTIFYAPILPLAYPIGVIALLLQYWADKFMLLKVHSRPDKLSDELDEAMLKFIAAGPVLYAATNMLFFYDFTETAFIPGIVGLVTTFAYNFLPVQRLVKAIKQKGMFRGGTLPADIEESESEKPYKVAMVDFVDDYDRCNPATFEEGKRKWIAAVLSQTEEQPEEAILQKAPKLAESRQAVGVLKNIEGMVMRRNLVTGGPKRRLTGKKLSSSRKLSPS